MPTFAPFAAFARRYAFVPLPRRRGRACLVASRENSGSAAAATVGCSGPASVAAATSDRSRAFIAFQISSTLIPGCCICVITTVDELLLVTLPTAATPSVACRVSCRRCRRCCCCRHAAACDGAGQHKCKLRKDPHTRRFSRQAEWAWN